MRHAWRGILYCVLAAGAASSLACDPDEEHLARLAELEARSQERAAEVESLSNALVDAEKQRDAAVEEAAAAAEKIEVLESNIGALEDQKGQLEGDLAKKKQMLAALEAVESELAKTLVAEVEAGEIRVSRRGGYLLVDVSDKVLFATGEAELKESGKEVLSKLAESLLKLPKDQVFQVGGHTDNQPIKSEAVKAKFPTNWELSAARATNVVRYLQEFCSVPGKRLVAAGFSAYRPTSSNKKKRGRARNRRIEIALLPPRN